jgi:hypothetical protein
MQTDNCTASAIFYTYGGENTFEDITLKDFDVWLKEHNEGRRAENCEGDECLEEYIHPDDCPTNENADDFTVHTTTITLKDFKKYANR